MKALTADETCHEATDALRDLNGRALVLRYSDEYDLEVSLVVEPCSSDPRKLVALVYMFTGPSEQADGDFEGGMLKRYLTESAVAQLASQAAQAESGKPLSLEVTA